jgi:serine phosphatase RsbU (regulator of sigma subunit)
MKRVTIFIVLILLGLKLPGQVNQFGIPLIKNYSAEVIHGSDYTHSIIKDDLGNLYLANEDMGIIRYDGYNWRTIPVRNNQLIRVLGKDSNGTIYAGGKYEFGFLETDSYGKMGYISLSKRFEAETSGTGALNDTSSAGIKPKINIGEILSLVVKDSSVLFVSKESLFNYDIFNDSLTYVSLGNLGLKNVLKAFLVDGKVFIGDNDKGLYEYNNGKVDLLPGGEFFNRMRCMVILPYDNSQALVATFEYGVYLFNFVTGEVSKTFVQPALQELLKGSRIYSGTLLPAGEYALGTIQGGVFVLNNNGELTKHWDIDNSNLMDNGVLAFYCDPSKNSELWISTIRFISKAYINIPFTEISPKSGINGGVDFICDMAGTTYISTDLGLYKSGLNNEGHLAFTKIPEIIDQVFPIYHAIVGEEEFLLAGSINGIFQIKKSGKVLRISGSALHPSGKDKKLDINVRIIVQSKVNPNLFYIGLNSEGVAVIEYKSGLWKKQPTLRCSQGSVVGIVEADNGDLLFATDFSNSVYRVAPGDTIPVIYPKDKGVPETAINSVVRMNGEIVLVTGKGLWKYQKVSDSWTPYNEVTGNFSDGKESLIAMQDHDNDIWFAFKDGRYSEILFRNINGKVTPSYGALALLPNVRLIDVKSIGKKIYLAKSNSVFVVDKEKLLSELPAARPLLSKIAVGRDSILMEESFSDKGKWGKAIPAASWKGVKIPVLKYTLNSVSFFWSMPFFINEDATLYSYKLDGFDSDWSNWEKVFYKDYTNLPFGHYYFRIKAKTATEVETTETVYEFVILKPWYLTAVMIVLYAIAFILIILGIIKAYTKKLKNENIRLEGIVAERTAVVVKQKEELESSIHYASRIQMALLPSEEILSENIKNYFVLFKPRDIVSGDFYWMTKKGNRLYIVAADCTGHGVPGAFMSLLGMSFLDEIIDKNLAPRADLILSELRLHVTESLKQVGEDNEAKDGMDMSLLVIDFDSQRIEFSGAYNPCFRVRKLTAEEEQKYKDNEEEMPDGSMSNGKYILETIYASKMPIGISSRMNEDFVFHDWALEKGISYYLFSDGYLDQFGGPHGRKFMKKNFKRLILDVQDHPMPKQKELLDNNLKEWMGHSPQIDDILVVGIRT